MNTCSFPATRALLVASLLALGGLGCSGTEGEPESCDPTATPETCSAADPTQICHPDDLICATSCAADTDCTLAGQKCDLTTKACRDASKIPAADCTAQGNACATDKVCDAAGTKTCIDPCTSTSCAAGQICNTTSKLCESDCTAQGATCGADQVCDQASKLCVAKCGANSCTADQVCGDSGNCEPACDAATDPAVCPPDTLCDLRTGGGSGKCIPSCDLTTGGTQCEENEFCQDDENAAFHGRCIEKCTTSNDCAGGSGYCRVATGKCEAKIDQEDCKPTGTTPEYKVVNPATNACEAVPAASGPDAAKRDTGNSPDVNGPIAFSATPTGYVPGAGTACGGGVAATILVGYHDYQGDFPIANINSRLDIAVRLAAGTAGGSDDLYGNGAQTPRLQPNSDGKSGVIEFTLCRPAGASARTFTLYLRDTQGNFGNSFDVNVPADT